MLSSAAQIVDALLFLGAAAALLWFVWRVLVRPLYRVWHIRRIEEARLMREAAAHQPQTDDQK